MGKGKYLKRYSLAGKIIAFILVIITVGIAIVSGIQATYMVGKNVNDIHKDFKSNLANRYAYSILDNVMWGGYRGYEINDSAVLGAKLVAGKDDKKAKTELVWSYGDLKNHKEPIEEYNVENVYSEADTSDESSVVKSVKSYDVVLYISKDIQPGSEFYTREKLADWLVKTQHSIYVIFIASLIIAIISLIYLLCAVGHKKDSLEIKGSFITKIPIDLYTILTTIAGIIIIGTGYSPIAILGSDSRSVMTYTMIFCYMYGGCAFISLLWLIDVAVRIKIGKWWQNSLIYKFVRLIGKSAAMLVGNLPLVWKTVLIYGVISLIEFMIIFIFSWNLSGAFIFAWLIEKVVLFVIVMMAAIAMKKLETAGEKISGGDLEYQVDTSHMYMDFKKHGENLNQIGQGLNAAVDERLKSERMKTELITNVSHDIKTPLTSIINYSDLIGKEETANEKINEYAEVLNRQSVRLKRLIEDLVEASKASTGNIEVNLEPTDVGVILTQAVGEYEDKLSASNLTLVVDKPEVPVMILADGRRLWRVLDNVLNNVCKYAMEGTRVYLNMTQDDNKEEVIITLKNISREPLDISPDELMERFVRGDKSRKTEGNGLGLSIAKSLVELQNGKMVLDIDGDLFKVTIAFKTQGEII